MGVGVPGLPVPEQFKDLFPAGWSYGISDATTLTSLLGVYGYPERAAGSRTLLAVALAIGYAIPSIQIIRKSLTRDRDLLLTIVASEALFLLLFPRGTYKYYYTMILPFLAPFLANARTRHVALQGFNVLLLLAPRVTTPWLSLLILTFLPRTGGSRNGPTPPPKTHPVHKL